MKLFAAPPILRAWFCKLPALSLISIFLLVEFFDELHYGVDSAALPVIRRDLALTYAQVGLLLGLPGLFSAFLEPLILLLGDTGRRKHLVIGGGLALVVALLLYAGAPSFPVLLLATVINYPASGAFVTLSQATLMDHNPGQEARMMARWTAAGSLGNLVGPLVLAAVFFFSLSWRWVFLFLAGFALVLVLLTGRIPYLSPAGSGRQANLDERSELPRQKEGLAATLQILWQAVRSPAMLRWVVLLELADLLLDTYTEFATLYFTDVVGFTPAQTSLAFAVLMAASLAADLLLIPILERYPGRRVVRLTALLSLIVYPAWLLAPWPLAKVVLAVTVQFTTLGWYPVLQGEAYAALPGRSGTVMALVSLAGILGGLLTWLLGWIAEQAGLPAALWLLLIGPISLLAFLPKESASPTTGDTDVIRL